ncbi:MAG: hypothetical protein RJQ08_11745 [Salinisphaeraceae bacterium]
MKKLTEREWEARRTAMLEAAEFLKGDGWTDNPLELEQGEIIAQRLDRMALHEGPRNRRRHNKTGR